MSELDKRAVMLAEQLAKSPGASIPKACGDWGQTQAAYRLLRHEDTSGEAVLQAHIGRMQAQPVALCLQDTTELKFDGQSAQGPGRPAIEMTCVIASEVNVPVGAKPVIWRLLSNRAVQTLEQAAELVEWYRARWEIELLFLVLKEGCRVERLQLGHVDRLETALAMYLIIAWRINRLMRLGRQLPELPAELFFEDIEWRVME